MGRTETSGSAVLTPRGITWTSVVANALLAAAKLVVGFFCHSQTIIADGLHSGSDLVTDAAILAGLRVSDKPADGCHLYGHRRVSTLVALFVGASLVVAAGWIAYGAANALHDLVDGRGRFDVRATLPFLVALASVPIKEVMFRATRLVARRSCNLSLLANAWHHRTDAFSSIAAAVGLGGVLVGGQSWRFLDPVFAIVLSAFLLAAAYRIMSRAAAELVDRAPSKATLDEIERVVAGTHGVRSHHAFRARQSAGKVEMDIHIQVDPTLSVQDGHDIASAVKRKVMAADGKVIEVIVHVEPAERESTNYSPRITRMKTNKNE